MRKSGSSLSLKSSISASLIKCRAVSCGVGGENRGTWPKTPTATKRPSEKGGILVAGSVAVDLSCDFIDDAKTLSPRLHTSNPASIRQSIGGVGNNVALAAHRASQSSPVKLCSLVGDDM